MQSPMCQLALSLHRMNMIECLNILIFSLCACTAMDFHPQWICFRCVFYKWFELFEVSNNFSL